jgi:hypothetical protein
MGDGGELFGGIRALGLSMLGGAGIVSWRCDGTDLGCPDAGCGRGLSAIGVSMKSQDVVEVGVLGVGDQLTLDEHRSKERVHGPLRLFLFSAHLRLLGYIIEGEITTGGSIIRQTSNNSPMLVGIGSAFRLISKRNRHISHRNPHQSSF